MRNIILSIFLVMLMAGCSASQQQVKLELPYEGKIFIGEQRTDILKTAEPVFGNPKKAGIIFKGTPQEVELRRYTFTNVHDFVMYFHQDVFIQAGLMLVDSPQYPTLRADFAQIDAERPGPVLGYTIFMNEQEVILDTIQP